MLRRVFTGFPRLSRVIVYNQQQLRTKRCLFTTSIPCARIYPNVETEFSYKIVRQQNKETVSNENEKIEFDFQDDYSGKSPHELVNDFEALSFYCRSANINMGDERLDKILKEFIRVVPGLSDEHLLKMISDLERFPLTHRVTTPQFYEFWKAMDKECCNRIKLWNYKQLLEIANLWYRVHLTKVGEFTYGALTKISRRLYKLSSKELVEAMFYLNLCRKSTQMHDVESRFLKTIHEMDINQIGIMCLAFFKTETKMRSFELIEKIYVNTINEIDNDIPDITLVNILKTLRYSSDPSHATYMQTLCEKLRSKIDACSILACLHIALLGTNLQFIDQTLMECIVQKFNTNIKETRLKDIERIAFALGLFDFKTETGSEKEFLQNILAELKLRIDEIMKYPKCFAGTLHYLTFKGVYDEEMISSVLKEDFINFAYGKNHFKIGREILCLDSFTRINLRDSYRGPRLSDKLRKYITKYQSHYIPERDQPYKLTHSDQLLLNLKEFMEENYGKNMLTHILPHYQRPDVIYCFDENGKSVTSDILDCFPCHYAGDILTKEYLLSQKQPFATKMDNYKMLAVIMGGWNFFLRDTSIPTGGLRTKVEQLQMIGYKTILLVWSDWIRMPSEERKAYLDNEIANALKIN